MGRCRIPQSFPNFRKSYVLLSDQNADTMVVFVHGLGGKPTSTWHNFQGLENLQVESQPSWNKADLFFYAYESLHTPIGYNATIFDSFVGHILSKSTGEGSDPCFSKSIGRSYKELLFVGHSEGAVVIRRMILDRFNAIKRLYPQNRDLVEALKTDIILNSRLRLFAPACMGTNFSSLLGFATSLSSLVSAVASSLLVRNELLPNSPVLEQIRAETEGPLASQYPVPASAAKVLFGSRDQVVYTASYNCDEIEYAIGHDHFSVCKPRSEYLKPLAFVL
jgi:hypothetical protein